MHQVAVRKGPNRNLYYSIILPYSTILLHVQREKHLKVKTSIVFDDAQANRYCMHVSSLCLSEITFLNKNVKLIVAMKHMAKIRMICAEISDLCCIGERKQP